MKLTFPTNTSKTHIHVEQFSQKTTWKRAEEFLYTQTCTKDSHTSRKHGKGRRVGTSGPGWGKALHTRTLTRGDTGWDSRWAFPSWDPSQRTRACSAAGRTVGLWKGWQSLAPTHKEWAGAGLPPVRAERTLRWRLWPHRVPRSS